MLRDSYLAVGDYDGLTDLYAENNDWEGLVEVLSGAADKATDPQIKIDPLIPHGGHLQRQAQRAGACFPRLRARPRHARRRHAGGGGAGASLRKGREVGAPARASTRSSSHSADEEEVDVRLALLQKLIDVTGHHLQDRGAAFGYAKRAYELAPEREEALVAFEKSARAAGQWQAFVDALNVRLKARKLKKEDKRALRAKLAEVYASELGRVDEAVATYRGLVEDDDKDDLAVATLDKILRTADRRDDLRWLFDLRVSRANTAHKLELLKRVGSARRRGLRRAGPGHRHLPTHAGDRAAARGGAARPREAPARRGGRGGSREGPRDRPQVISARARSGASREGRDRAVCTSTR